MLCPSALRISYQWLAKGVFVLLLGSACEVATMKAANAQQNAPTEQNSGQLAAPNQEPVQLANAFSPNGDGQNDAFNPYPGRLTRYTLTVYDRHGHVIFTGANTPWDGTRNETPVEEGLYVFSVEGRDTTNVVVRESGTVRLIR